MVSKNNRQISTWLLVCCFTVFSMVVLGGVTRLTGSGLSMVEWEPIMGIVPPMNDAEWEHTFKLYQQYPEYQKKNFHMSVDDFKSIFWFEYAHRLLGRTIGVLFLIPFLFFLFAGKIEKTLRPKLITMFVLGGLQGLMGWYMVKSGLVDNPHVSQYRLTAHLGLAIIIYMYMLWVALDLLFPKEQATILSIDSKIPKYARVLTGFIFFTILSGGFVAGTRAGFAFNTFPLMDGKLIPDGLYQMSPVWHNFFENIVTVQFNHRVLAILLFFTTVIFILFSLKERLKPLTKTSLYLLLAAVILHLTLGISTLLLAVPIPLAAAHQGGAVILLTAALFVNNQLRYQS